MVQLEDLLDKVAEALLAGDLSLLATLAPKVEAGVATLSTRDPVRADRLRAKAGRNARLLDAAARGVKAARNRMSEIARGHALTTYDSRGQRATIASVGLAAVHRV
jgi:HAMP domain-containing protein